MSIKGNNMSKIVNSIKFYLYWFNESVLDFVTGPIKREGALHFENGIQLKGNTSNCTPKEIQSIELEPSPGEATESKEGL